MKKILVPTDFSDQAENALKVAANMVANNGGEIYILSITVLKFHYTLPIPGRQGIYRKPCTLLSLPKSSSPNY